MVSGGAYHPYELCFHLTQVSSLEMIHLPTHAIFSAQLMRVVRHCVPLQRPQQQPEQKPVQELRPRYRQEQTYQGDEDKVVDEDSRILARAYGCPQLVELLVEDYSHG
jgi:hypothetical protein